jgi:hypothetical protein
MGVSLHRYPRVWLLERARQGDLFAYHVGHEGVALQDGNGFLLDLRTAFSRRTSYAVDVRVGLLVARLMAETSWDMDAGLRRRFFWGVRTCLISSTAQDGSPIFSAPLLESLTRIDGLADLLGRRATASFEECRGLADRLERFFPSMVSASLKGDALRASLTEAGGYAAECARASEKRVWEEGAEVAVYA